jgi:hypothetical protein
MADGAGHTGQKVTVLVLCGDAALAGQLQAAWYSRSAWWQPWLVTNASQIARSRAAGSRSGAG